MKKKFSSILIIITLSVLFANKNLEANSINDVVKLTLKAKREIMRYTRILIYGVKKKINKKLTNQQIDSRKIMNCLANAYSAAENSEKCYREANNYLHSCEKYDEAYDSYYGCLDDLGSDEWSPGLRTCDVMMDDLESNFKQAQNGCTNDARVFGRCVSAGYSIKKMFDTCKKGNGGPH